VEYLWTRRGNAQWFTFYLNFVCVWIVVWIIILSYYFYAGNSLNNVASLNYE
jgi:hypothetical protein